MIDSEKIIAEIRNELKDKPGDDVLSFDTIPMPAEVSYMGAEIADFDLGDLMESNDYINKHFQVSVWHPTVSVRPVIGPLIVFFSDIHLFSEGRFVENVVSFFSSVSNVFNFCTILSNFLVVIIEKSFSFIFLKSSIFEQKVILSAVDLFK